MVFVWVGWVERMWMLVGGGVRGGSGFPSGWGSSGWCVGGGMVGCRAENTERGDIVLAWRRTMGGETRDRDSIPGGRWGAGSCRAFLWGR